MPFSEKLLPSLPSISQMQKWDMDAINFGLPATLLMENASRSALKLLFALQGPMQGKKVLAFMGGGNNGGDSVCLARIMQDQGIQVLVAHTRSLDDLTGAARFHADLALKDKVQFYSLDPAAFPEFRDFMREKNFVPDVILDGLVGLALRGELSPEMIQLIDNINFYTAECRAFMLALDVPSGLNADTGQPMPTAIRAHATASMAYAKKGLVLPNARPYTGSLHVCDIGMPKVLAAERIPDLYMLDGRLLLSPARLPENSYKNVFGHVTVIGGNKGLSGAAHLASLAALRSGAGLVTACAPPSSIGSVKASLAELMIIPVGEHDNWPSDIPENLGNLLQSSSALVIGPGMGRDDNSSLFLHSLLVLENRPPAVFDADALYILSQMSNWKSLLTEKDVITPHPGEAAKLLDCSISDLERDRIKGLLKLMENLSATVVLKGVNTLIGQSSLPALLCPYDIPQMAIGGAGDVLSGCIAALLARRNNKEPVILSCAKAVIKHIFAGMICAQNYPERGALASDLANALAHVHDLLSSLDTYSLKEGLMPWPK